MLFPGALQGPGVAPLLLAERPAFTSIGCPIPPWHISEAQLEKDLSVTGTGPDPCLHRSGGQSPIRACPMTDGRAGGHFSSLAAGVGARIFLDVQITGRLQSIRGPLGPGARGDRLVWASGLRLTISSTTSPASARSGTARQQSRSRVRTWLTCTNTPTGQTAPTQPALKRVRTPQHRPCPAWTCVILHTGTEAGTPT